MIQMAIELVTANNIPDWVRLPSGCSTIDTITRGGFPFTGINEIFGCSGVGKTQICLQLALMVQLPPNSNAAVYICTENVFPSKRLNELANIFENRYNVKNLQDNIFIEHVADLDELNQCILQHIPRLSQIKSVGLVVIDSIAGLFRSENVGENYANRSQAFIQLTTKLHKLAKKCNFAVICVNQVSDNIDSRVTVPALGLSWSNLVTCRFGIYRYTDDAVRDFEIVFAPDLPNISCKFQITENGIVGY